VGCDEKVSSGETTSRVGRRKKVGDTVGVRSTYVDTKVICASHYVTEAGS
jgi:hypothetical protein